MDQPTWNSRCFNPRWSLKMFGMKARNPRDMTKRLTRDMSRRCGIRRALVHKSKLNNGERTSRIEGIPRMRCNLRGKGKIPAPPMEMV